MTVDGCDCMSAITQKKGELGDSEENLIRKYKCAWGCDICQDVCPITVRQKMSGEIYTSVPFFCESITPHLTPEAVSSMSEAEFEQRAYSWRGRGVILRNLFLTEGGNLKNEAEEKKREGERKEGSQERK
jgi:epoxyqueuosine reductase QueG